MGDNGQLSPDGEAKKWFILALLGTLVYVSIVFKFVITPDVGPQIPAEVEQHGQPE